MPVEEGGILWCGIHEDEAWERHFESGIGYQNFMCQRARSPQFDLTVDASVGISFEYFLNTETGWDYVYVNLHCFDDTGQPLDEVLVSSLTGVEGSPEVWAEFAAVVGAAEIPSGTHLAQLGFFVEADGAWSDQDGGWDSPCGPLGVDQVRITIGGGGSFGYNFDTGPDGWTFEKCASGGQSVMGTVPESAWVPWVEESGLTDWPMTGNVLEFLDNRGNSRDAPSMPVGSQAGQSGPVVQDVSLPPGCDETIVRYSTFLSAMGPMFRPGYRVYPSPGEGGAEDRWSLRRGQNTWWHSGTAQAETWLANLTNLDGLAGEPLPAEWDSVRVVFEFYNAGAPLGLPDRFPTAGAPLLDDLQVGLVWLSSSVDGEPGADPYAEQPGFRQALNLRVEPNPITTSGTLRFRLPTAETGCLRVVDSNGRLVRQVVQGELAAGDHHFSWDGRAGDGRPVPTGVYWAELSVAGQDPVACSVVVLER